MPHINGMDSFRVTYTDPSTGETEDLIFSYDVGGSNLITPSVPVYRTVVREDGGLEKGSLWRRIDRLVALHVSVGKPPVEPRYTPLQRDYESHLALWSSFQLEDSF